MHHIKLSIVIPSKNRFIYAKECIKSILTMKNTDFEVVVVDNSDDDQLQKWSLDFIDDVRLIYVKKDGYCSLSDNFQAGIDTAKGEYVCTIGDDDGINPEIMHVIDWAIENKIDAITPKFIADYTWPDLQEVKLNSNHLIKKNGVLRIKSFSGKMLEYDPQKGLRKIAHTCGMDLADSFYIPKIYYGIIRREILSIVKHKIGTNFPGISPDLSGAITVANFVESFYILDYPLFISGSSLKSASGASSLRMHHGNLDRQEHLKKGYIANWPSKIPRFYSVESMWSQSALESLRAIQREDLLRKFNYPKIYATSLMFNFAYKSYVFNSFKQKDNFRSTNYTKDLIYVILEFMGLIIRRARYFLKNNYNKATSGLITIDNLQTINNANKALLVYLEKNHYSIQKVLFNG
jgi:glycosyltransferase involved in cell wall biosynthesis